METKPETIKVGRVLRTSSSGLLMPPHLMFPCSPKSGKALLAIWAYNFIPCSAFFLCTRKGIGAVVFFFRFLPLFYMLRGSFTFLVISIHE